MCMLYLMQEKWHCANFFKNCSCRLAANAKIYLENGVKFLEKSWKNPGILWLRKSGNPAHVTLDDKICCAKLDTGAQINTITESLFKRIGKTNKLPLFLKSDVKLVGYGNRNIEYIGTTVLDVAHLTQTKKATFYVTKLSDDKAIQGLHLCIDLQLLSIHCDDKCRCKSQILHEAKKIGSEFSIGVDLQLEHTQQDVLPPVPISTKLEGDDVKHQIMELYTDLFSGVGTIKNAMVHLRCQTRCHTSCMFTMSCSPCSSTQTKGRTR